MRIFRSRAVSFLCLGGATLAWQWVCTRTPHAGFTSLGIAKSVVRSCRTVAQNSALSGEASSRATTLLLSSDADAASITLKDGVLSHGAFEWTPCGENKWRAQGIQNSRVYLWHRLERLSALNGIDEEWSAEDGPLTDMIFLSRHKASSGKPSLTVHPIGNLRSDLEPMGGVAGKLSPPSPRMASLLRALATTCSSEPHASLSDFDLTFEATHHGPLVSTPAVFAEIGSGEAEWGRTDAGQCWADTLWCALSKPAMVHQNVLICVGGTHYMPQVNDMAAKHLDLAVGHMLPSYAFKDISEEVLESMLREALVTTAKAYPCAQQLLFYMSKKVLKSAERKLITAVLERCQSTLEGPTVVLVKSGRQVADKLQALELSA